LDHSDEIDLRELIAVVRRRWRVIALITVLALAISAALTFLVLAPVYEASATMIVMKQNAPGVVYDYNEVMLARRLSQTYSEIAESRRIAELVRKEIPELTVEDIEDQVTVAPVGDTELIEVTAEDTSPERAMKLANTLAEVFELEIQKIVNVENVEIVDTAAVPEHPVRPRKLLNLALAGILGLMLGVFGAFVAEFLDTRIKDEDDVERHLGLPVLGVIPTIDPRLDRRATGDGEASEFGTERLRDASN